LPQSIDDAEREYGVGIYDFMQETCSELDLAYRFLRDRVFSEGVNILPAVDPPLPTDTDSKALSDYALSLEIASFVQQQFDNMQARRESPMNTLHLLFSAVKSGRSLAELSFEAVSFNGKRRIGLSEFRFIPRKNYSVVTKPTGEILGVIGIIPGKGSPLYSGLISNPEVLGNFVPIERLMLFVVNPSEHHPVGQSIFRSSYRSWHAIRMTEPIEMASLGQFGGQGMVLIPGESGFVMRKVKDPISGEEFETSEIEFVSKLMSAWTPGSALILPPGWSKMDIGGDGNADGFKTFFDRHARKMIASVLYSASTIVESERNSQAKADQTDDVTNVAVQAIRSKFSTEIQAQVFRTLVRLNWGDEIAQTMTPRIALAQVSSG
jgi:hypothetical protein